MCVMCNEVSAFRTISVVTTCADIVSTANGHPVDTRKGEGILTCKGYRIPKGGKAIVAEKVTATVG